MQPPETTSPESLNPSQLPTETENYKTSMSQQTTLHPTDHLTTENQTTKLTLTENATNDHNITTNYYGSDVSCQETQTNTLLLAGKFKRINKDSKSRYIFNRNSYCCSVLAHNSLYLVFVYKTHYFFKHWLSSTP